MKIEDGELYLIAGPDPRQPFDPNRPSLIIRLEPSFPFLFGDLNSDLMITAIDWNLFKAGQGTDFSGLTPEQSYLFGDLDADFDHDLSDFLLFRTAYEQFNGGGSFAAMLNAPEPSSIALLCMSLCLAAGTHNRMRRRHSRR